MDLLSHEKILLEHLHLLVKTIIKMYYILCIHPIKLIYYFIRYFQIHITLQKKRNFIEI